MSPAKEGSCGWGTAQPGWPREIVVFGEPSDNVTGRTDNRMRIVLAHSHANTLGGGERAVLELGRGLQARHDVKLLLGGFDPQHTYPELSSLPRANLGRLQWPIARLADADAIVTNSFGANLLALRNGPRVAYWAHSTRSLFLQTGARRIDLRLRRALDWIAVRRSAQLVANSRFTAGRLRQLYGREADAVVYPGVDLSLFSPGQAGATGYAISVGRLSPEKGLDRLLDLWRDVPDVPLHIVGDGSPEMVRHLRSLAPPGVIFRGRLTSTALAEAYRGAAVAVFAPYAEEFGMAPLEAMACGVPVVAWREGGLPETILDGETGYLVSDSMTLRQCVRGLLHDAELRRAFGEAARRRAEGFTWHQTTLGMESVVQRLAATPVRAPGA